MKVTPIFLVMCSNDFVFHRKWRGGGCVPPTEFASLFMQRLLLESSVAQTRTFWTVC